MKPNLHQHLASALTPTLFLASTILLLGCTDTKKSVLKTFSDKNPVHQSCQCEYYKDKSFPLYATNLTVNQKTIRFNCAELEVAIAEKADLNGVPQGCVNLYSLKCVSAKSQQLTLNEKFTYSKSETSTGTQADFYKDQKDNPKAFYKFSLNDQNQIVDIQKIEFN